MIQPWSYVQKTEEQQSVQPDTPKSDTAPSGMIMIQS
jgi:hypothetical protein